LGFEKSQRSVTHDSLRYINILTYLLTYLLTYIRFLVSSTVKVIVAVPTALIGCCSVAYSNVRHEY